MLDGIVPVEHSLYFLSSLVVRSSNLNASKNFKLESSNNAYTDVDAVTDDYTRYKNVAKRDDNGLPSKKKISVSGNNIDTVLPKELRKSVEVRKFQSEGLIQASENRVAALCVDTQWLMREQDAIVTLPGAKHSFEAVGGDVVDIVCEGVINWLSKVK